MVHGRSRPCWVVGGGCGIARRRISMPFAVGSRVAGVHLVGSRFSGSERCIGRDRRCQTAPALATAELVGPGGAAEVVSSRRTSAARSRSIRFSGVADGDLDLVELLRGVGARLRRQPVFCSGAGGTRRGRYSRDLGCHAALRREIALDVKASRAVPDAARTRHRRPGSRVSAPRTLPVSAQDQRRASITPATGRATSGARSPLRWSLMSRQRKSPAPRCAPFSASIWSRNGSTPVGSASTLK